MHPGWILATMTRERDPGMNRQARLNIPQMLPMLAIAVSVGCHSGTRFGMFRTNRIQTMLAAPPPDAPERASRDLERSTGRLQDRFPEGTHGRQWIGVVFFNHAGVPVARALVLRSEGGSPIVSAEQIEPYQGWQSLDANEFKSSRDDAKRAHEMLGAVGPAPRSIEDVDSIRLTLPGSVDDNEVWLVIPTNPEAGIDGSWSYSNDMASIEAGRLGAWIIEEVVECRSF